MDQDQMTVTPLQMFNSMCIIANKAYYYVPHVVRSIEGETKEDTTLKRYRQKHEALTHIPDDVF